MRRPRLNQATNPILKWLAEGRASSTTQVCVHPLALAHHPPLQWTYNDKIKSSTLGLNDGHHQHWINLRRQKNEGHDSGCHPKKPPPPTSNPATWHILIHQRRPYQTKKMPSIKLNMASASCDFVNTTQLPRIHHYILWFLKQIQWTNQFKNWMSQAKKLTNVVHWFTENYQWPPPDNQRLGK